jgi:hypothetical protein
LIESGVLSDGIEVGDVFIRAKAGIQRLGDEMLEVRFRGHDK